VTDVGHDVRLAGAISKIAPGIVCAADRNGEPWLRHIHGVERWPDGPTLSPNTSFALGSITKSFVAALALCLQQRGVVDLDDGIRRWLPALPLLQGEPTLRQLLDHSSGYRCYLDAEFVSGLALRPAGAALAFALRQRGTNFAPGSQQLYANSNYVIAALALEQAGQGSIERLLDTYVFGPLSMTRTHLARTAARRPSGSAQPHIRRADGSYMPGFDVTAEHLGDGGAYGTISDLLCWSRFLRGEGRLVTDESREQFMRRPACNATGPRGYALGLQIDRQRDLETIGHGGAVVGGRALVLAVPALDLDIAIASNGEGALEPIAAQIIDLCLGRPLATTPDKRGPPFHRGTYYSRRTGWLATLAVHDGQPAIGLFSGPVVPLTPHDDRFTLPAATGTIEVLATVDPGAIDLVVGGVADRLDRLPDPGQFDVCALVGRYCCNDVGGVIEISVGDDAPVITTTGLYGSATLGDIRLAGHDLLTVGRLDTAPFPAVLAFERDAAGRITDLAITTARTRRLPFVREPGR
jgi:D-aminopeptidase